MDNTWLLAGQQVTVVVQRGHLVTQCDWWNSELVNHRKDVPEGRLVDAN